MDSGDEIYVWVGSGAQPEEKAQGVAIAKVKSYLFGVLGYQQGRGNH